MPDLHYFGDFAPPFELAEGAEQFLLGDEREYLRRVCPVGEHQ